jgi:hypothetical protein
MSRLVEVSDFEFNGHDEMHPYFWFVATGIGETNDQAENIECRDNSFRRHRHAGVCADP